MRGLKARFVFGVNKLGRGASTKTCAPCHQLAEVDALAMRAFDALGSPRLSKLDSSCTRMMWGRLPVASHGLFGAQFLERLWSDSKNSCSR